LPNLLFLKCLVPFLTFLPTYSCYISPLCFSLLILLRNMPVEPPLLSRRIPGVFSSEISSDISAKIPACRIFDPIYLFFLTHLKCPDISYIIQCMFAYLQRDFQPA